MNKTQTPILIYYGALITVCIIWVGLSLFHFHDYLASGFFLCILISATFLKLLEKEITNEKYENLEKKLKRQEAKAWYFESIVTNSRDIIFTTDLEHRIVKFNKGSEQTFGIMAFEVLGKHVNTLFERPERIDALLEELDEKGRSRAIELMIRNQESGDEIWLSVGVSKLFDMKEGGLKLLNPNRRFIGEIFTCKNVTQRRMLEKELKEKNEQLTTLSITDGLTSLYNVRHLKSEAIRLQKIHHRFPERPLSLALIDVDKFKEYNDNYGHLAGDKLLVILSDIIQAQIRKDLDLAFRYGGDEFVLLFPDTDARGSQKICERILSDFLNHHMGSTALSIGVTGYKKEWGLLSVSLLVSKADEAMYQIKCHGGNGIHIYSKPLDAEVTKRGGTIDPDSLR